MEVFFYGLFMDQNILSQKGITGENPRIATLNNYELQIGERASLISKSGQVAYGVLMSVDKEDLDELYSETSVADYIPEELTVKIESGDEINAICYNLPLDKMKGRNTKYAKELLELASKLGFLEDYLEKIKRMAE